MTKTDDNYIVPLIINGEDIANTSATFPVTSPVDHSSPWHSSALLPSSVASVVDTAQVALSAWRKTDPSTRRTIFLKAADLMEQQSDELSSYEQTETGATAAWAGFDVSLAVEMLRDVAGRVAGAVVGSVPWCQKPGQNAMVVREPYGVVLAIAPWNAPYILGMRSVLYPLAAGNTCILKGSEFSPRVFHSIGAIFRSAGLPNGCLNVVYHRPSDAPEITTALIAHPSVKKINFTGSTPVGSIIAQTAAKYIKPVLMELGGKAPAIVMADADLQLAAQQCVLGSFFHAGQVCMSTERIIVHESIAEEFAAALASVTEKMFDPKGEALVMVSKQGAAKTKKLVDDAIADGATPIVGSKPSSDTSPTRMRPIILSNLPKTTALYQAESFGPSATLYTYTSESEAIALANNTDFGLSSAVFSRDLGAALRVARQIESGAVHINDMTIHDEPGLPHGGVKSSGWGRFGANAGLDEFLRSKTITWMDS